MHMNANKQVRAFLIVLITLWMVGCSTTSPHSQAGHDTKDGNDDITSRLLKIEEEWAKVDIIIGKDPQAARAVLERILARDFVNTNRKGKVTNKHDFIEAFEDDGVQSAANTDMEVHVYAGNVVVVTGIDNTKGKDKAGNEFSHQDRFTDTYVNRNDVWQCVSAQSARIK
jgi:ketosteroid isomerase-like protein